MILAKRHTFTKTQLTTFAKCPGSVWKARDDRKAYKNIQVVSLNVVSIPDMGMKFVEPGVQDLDTFRETLQIPVDELLADYGLVSISEDSERSPNGYVYEKHGVVVRTGHEESEQRRLAELQAEADAA